jgi:N-acetylmuramoyl-L-alanine amidase
MGGHPRLAPLLGSIAFALVIACGSGEEAPAPPDRDPTPAPPRSIDPTLARGMALDELRAAEEDASRAAEDLGPTAEGVAALRHAAMLARVRAEREPSGNGLARSRALLVEASRRRTLAGACEAALELASLEVEVAHDEHAGSLVLHRATRRFTEEEHATCAATAQLRLEALPPLPHAELAAIDADPDADDPTVGLVAPSTPPLTEDEAATSLAAWARTASAAEAARLEAMTVVSPPGATSVRVVLAFDHVAVFERRDLPADGALPARLVLDLASTSIAPGVATTTSVDTAGLVRLRTTSDASGARVTLDLAPTATAHLFLLPEPYRILIDVSLASVTAPVVSAAEHPPVHLVVLDPGHGGDDYGARAFRLHEADLTLDIALRTRDALARRRPDIRVVLTRENDTFVSLEQRTAMANAVSADLFVSIHLNAAWEPVDHGGVTTFVLDTTDDRQLVRLAARENGTSTSEVTALERILAGLHREGQGTASRALAERIHRATLVSGRRILPHLHDRGVRSAMFYVLVGATMPAVLVETSFLTREDEADALRTERYRDALASGIAEGITRYAAPL